MNEGHSALLGVELLCRYDYPVEIMRSGETSCVITRGREMCSFTSHTPVDTGHDRFEYDLVSQTYDRAYDLALISKLAGEDKLNMTRLALNLSEYINGVAKTMQRSQVKCFPAIACTLFLMSCIHSRGLQPSLANSTTCIFGAGAMSRNC